MPTSIIGSLPRFAASNGWSPIDDRYYEGIGQVTSSGVRVTPALAFNLSAVWACTRAVAQPLGMVPLPLYGYLENGNGRTVRRLAQQHPLYSLIHDAPNPEQTAMEFRETIVAWALNLGGGHARIVPDRATGRPIGSLELIPPASLTIKRTPDGKMQYVVRDDAGRSTTYLSDEIFKVRGLSLDGVTGVSVIEYARETIGEAYGQQQYGSKYWAGSSMPRGVFRYDKEVSAEMRRKMEVEFAARYSGTQNAHKTPVLPYGLQWQQIGISNKDAEWLSARQFSLGEFERWYGVPAHIIADLMHATFSNIEEQSLEYLTYTLHPWGVRVEQAIKRDLIFEPEIRAKHVWDALLRGRTKERYEAHQLAILTGWKSPNEVRELEELDPIDGLDEYLIPANMVPLSQLSQRITALGSQANALALDAAERLVTIETREVQRAAVDHGNGDGWQEWVDEFYGGEYAEKLAKMLHISPEKANAIAGEHRRELLTTGAKQSLARWNIEAPGHLAGVAVGVEREAQRV